MSIRLNTECLLCHLRRNLETARGLGNEETAMAFAKELLQQYLDAPEDASSPTLGPGANALFQKYYGLEADRFRQEKEESNRFVLARIGQIQDRIARAEDPLFAALQFAILGNYTVAPEFQSILGHAALDLFGKLYGVVFRKAFQYCFKQDTVCTLGNILGGRHYFNIVFLQRGFIKSGVITVTGKAVKFPYNNDIK